MFTMMNKTNLMNYKEIIEDNDQSWNSKIELQWVELQAQDQSNKVQSTKK